MSYFARYKKYVYSVHSNIQCIIIIVVYSELYYVIYYARKKKIVLN